MTDHSEDSFEKFVRDKEEIIERLENRSRAYKLSSKIVEKTRNKKDALDLGKPYGRPAFQADAGMRNGRAVAIRGVSSLRDKYFSPQIQLVVKIDEINQPVYAEINHHEGSFINYLTEEVEDPLEEDEEIVSIIARTAVKMGIDIELPEFEAEPVDLSLLMQS